MPDLGVPELIIIAVVIMVLFGAKKLPDAARSVGRSMRIFKSEMKSMGDDDNEQQQPVKELPAAPVAATPATPVAAEPAAERAETR